MKFVLTLLFKCSNVQTIHCSGQRSNMLVKEEVHCTALHFDIYCFMMNEELSWALGKYPRHLLSLVFLAFERCNYANPEQEESPRIPKNLRKWGNSSSSWV
jgi:hypothetical protein